MDKEFNFDEFMEQAKDVYTYLSAVANGLKEFSNQLKDGDK